MFNLRKEMYYVMLNLQNRSSVIKILKSMQKCYSVMKVYQILNMAKLNFAKVKFIF